jgi:16S rRNA (adenine1518-N6/adenine1519-N6)-dimethyltransferase
MVSPKKHLGQHFLTDHTVSERIVERLKSDISTSCTVLEIGPGTGALTVFLKDLENPIVAMDVDTESIEFLKTQEQYNKIEIWEKDFLKNGLDGIDGDVAIVGNFPYNISTQIIFTMLDNIDRIPVLNGMFQKEVAERICSSHGSKVYGILSVLVQFYYSSNYLFTVDENVFNPPPKVKSGVLTLNRLENSLIEEVPYSFAKAVVKAAFNQRRKTLRNSLKAFVKNREEQWLNLRPEQMSVYDFAEKIKLLYEHSKPQD